MDITGIPTRECLLCGCDIFYTRIKLDHDYTVGMYWLDGVCANCGAEVTLGTEQDYEARQL